MKKNNTLKRKLHSLLGIMLAVSLIFSVFISPAAVFADESGLCIHDYAESCCEIPDEHDCVHQDNTMKQPCLTCGETDTAVQESQKTADNETSVNNDVSANKDEALSQIENESRDGITDQDETEKQDGTGNTNATEN